MSDSRGVYLDTSVLAKWYLSETNSESVSAYIVQLDVAVISTLTKTEMRCLLARRKRMREFDASVEAQIYATFLDDVLIVPTLQRGNAAPDAPASRLPRFPCATRKAGEARDMSTGLSIGGFKHAGLSWATGACRD